VIDVGCASGTITEEIAGYIRAIVGVDFIPGLIDDAFESRRSDNTSYICADAENLPFASNRFSKAYCYNVIHNLPNDEAGMRVIREILRVCAHGAIILIGDIPDIKKRSRYLRPNRRVTFLGSSPRQKLKMLARLLLPLRLRAFLRRLLLPTAASGPTFVWYDLQHMKATFEHTGMTCRVIDQPEGLHDHYYRSSLLIHKP
jgi:SAM-dependent methyltransferase